LEQTQHDHVSWVTLTYNDENLPFRNELTKNHHVVWIKKLRKAYPSKKIKYYLSAEYGDAGGRPHYHVALFGIGFDISCLRNVNPKLNGLAKLEWIKKENGKYLYPNKVRNLDPDILKMLKIWNKGNIHFENQTQGLLQYGCKHITKDLASIEDQTQGRAEQYHSMTPGLGKDAMHVITQWLCTEEGVKHYKENNDVPSAIRVGGKIRPIGKYLRNIIRRNLDLPEQQPDNAIKQRSLRELARQLDEPDYKEKQRTRDKLKAKKTLQFQRQRRSI
jgi:hypothetical protein